ncbi:MAG: hypothetical protein KGJ96_13690, partial [Xanthomonadaceae bacterium]|nr:hypothetical protein [Xanthomonadaceae bacterium]
RRVRQARALRAQLRAAFDPVLDEPVPARLSARLRPASPPAAGTAVLRPMQAARRGFAGTRQRAARRWWVPGAAIAASVALLAMALWWRQDGGLIRMHDGQRFAAGTLSQALDRGLASRPDPHAPIAIGLSFRSKDGSICRTFTERTRPAMAGLACHAPAGWSLAALEPAEKPAGGPWRQAASSLPAAVQAAVDARIKGEAFDARQERAARDAGWR